MRSELLNAEEERVAVRVKAAPCLYTTRLQKGGAMLVEMRQLVRRWNDGPLQPQRDLIVRENVLSKSTRARTADVLRRSFLPRFVEGPIPEAWKLVRPLEDAGAALPILRPVYYWITAKAELMLGDFCREYLLTHQAIAYAGIGLPEVLHWLHKKNCHWSPTVSSKVARGLLAALRDFGILEGRAKKRLANISVPVSAFAYVAFCLHQMGAVARSLVSHEDWGLFLLQPSDVEHLFFVAHQHRLLEYHAAGSTVSIRFGVNSFTQYAQIVVERSN